MYINKYSIKNSDADSFNLKNTVLRRLKIQNAF